MLERYLSPVLKTTYDAIAKYADEHSGVSPTQRELREILGVTETKMRNQLNALKTRGFIRITPYAHRGIRIGPFKDPPTPEDIIMVIDRLSRVTINDNHGRCISFAMTIPVDVMQHVISIAASARKKYESVG